MSAAARVEPAPHPAPLVWLAAAALALIVSGTLLHTSGLDPAWMAHVHAQSPLPGPVLLWSCVTVLGLGSSALILVLAADRGDGRIAALLLPTFVLGAALTHLPKWLLAVPRPMASSLASQLHVIGQTFSGPVSMPSGHAVTAGAATLLLCLALPRARPPAVGLLVFAGATVAWSRVVVGAHWPSDVFVGAGLGMFAVVLVLRAAAWPGCGRLHGALVRRIRTRSGQITVAAIECAVALGLLAERTGYPDGRPMVLALATLAAGSAVLRCRFALAGSSRAPAEPT